VYQSQRTINISGGYLGLTRTIPERRETKEIQCANNCGNLTMEGSEFCEICEEVEK